MHQISFSFVYLNEISRTVTALHTPCPYQGRHSSVLG
jgi:hypothetical protein